MDEQNILYRGQTKAAGFSNEAELNRKYSVAAGGVMPPRALLVKVVLGFILIVLGYYFITRFVLVSVILHH